MLQLEISIRVSDRDYQHRATVLGKEDFTLRIARQFVPGDRFEVDNLCKTSEHDRPPRLAPPDEPNETRATGAFKGHLVLYVDYLHLRSILGQMNTPDMIRNMIPELIHSGNRLKIVAGLNPVQTLVDWSADEEHILKQLNESQDMSFPFLTKNQLLENDIAAQLGNNHIKEAVDLARAANLSQQAQWQVATDPLAEFVGRMVNLPRPKALFYFADSSYPGRAVVVEKAIAAGVRIYAIKANGMVTTDPSVPLHADPDAQARSDFSSIASRTGGRVALGHYKKSAIAQPLRYLREDYECVYLISVDVGNLERDRDLAIDVGLTDELKGHMRADTIPHIRIASEGVLREQAAAAFASPESGNIRTATLAVIPSEVSTSGVKALLQFVVDTDSALPLASAPWDVGIISAGESRLVNQSDRRIESNALQIIFETAVEFPLGTYRAIGAAQEVDRQGCARNDLAGRFTKPRRRSFGFLHPVAVMQWTEAAFVFEEEEPRFEGWAALRYKMAHTNAAISFRSVLCRGKAYDDTLRVDRRVRIQGRDTAFEPVMWKFDSEDLCLPLSDIISAGELPWNGKPYEVTYSIRANEPSESDRVAVDSVSFWVIGPELGDRVNFSN